MNENIKKVAIMQPYFLPYLGYFQVMNAVDQYVVYDDVNFIKGGRINRNEILANGQAQQINILLFKASPNKHINEITLLPDAIAREKLIKTITLNYNKAPYYETVFPLVKEILLYDESNLALFLYHSFQVICKYLGIKTELILSSDLKKDCSLKAEEKVYHICHLLQATDYYNSIGGKELYSHEEFEKQNLHLHFLTMNPDVKYKQFKNEFVPNLSILDVMMFNSVEEIQQLLQHYSLS